MAAKKPAQGAGKSSIKELLVLHVEKLVFGVVALLVITFVITGYSRETPDDRLSPESLLRDINSAKVNIVRSTWEEVNEQRQPVFIDFHRKADDDDDPIAAGPYRMRPFDPPYIPLNEARIDPPMLPVRNLIVRAGNGPFAYIPPEDEAGVVFQRARREEDIAVRPRRRLDRYIEERIPGHKGNLGDEAIGHRFVVLTGVVSLAEQQRIYDDAFMNANAYDESRDVVRYVWHYVQRQEVDGNGQPVGEWTNLGRKALLRESEKWAGSPQELTYEAHVDNILTFMPFPLMMRDGDAMLSHPEVSTIMEMERLWEEEAVAAANEVQSEVGDEGPDDTLDGAGAGRARGGAGRRFGAAPRMGGRGRGMLGIGMGGPGGERRRPVPRGGAEEVVADVLLFRFYDLNLEPGKSYRYRVQLTLEDPNNPYDLDMRPPRGALDKDVVERIDGLAQPTQTRRGVYYRRSDWSEPSAPATIPVDHQLLASTPKAEKMLTMHGTKVQFPSPTSEESSCSVMALVWDNAQAMDVAGEMKVFRGSVVDFAQPVEVLQPTKREYMDIEDYKFETGMLVADLRGGERLPGRASQNATTAPSELMLIDASGNISVINEVDDYTTYAQYKLEDLEVEDEGDPAQFPGGIPGGIFDDFRGPGAGAGRGARRGRPGRGRSQDDTDILGGARPGR